MLIRLVLFAFVVASSAGCADGGNGGTSLPPPPPPPPPAPGTVAVRNDEFVPATITVTVGGTVTWIWEGQDHNVTSVLAPAFGPNSQTRNAPFTHGPLTFNTPGTYRYICTIHGAVSGGQTTGMRGVVVVQ
jgi:plastocyanin